jgi:Berberine and berberine like
MLTSMLKTLASKPAPRRRRSQPHASSRFTTSILAYIRTTTGSSTSRISSKSASTKVRREASILPSCCNADQSSRQPTATGAGTRVESARCLPGTGGRRCGRTAIFAVAAHDGDGEGMVNFIDPRLPDWRRAYYRDNYDRLTQIKHHYDPHDFFHFPQSIGS